MRILKILSLSILALALTAGAARAEVETYSFDKLHTQIFFSVNHMGFSNSTGKFPAFDGQFILDRADPAKSSVEVTIDTASIEMGDQKWEDHLKNADFFNVEKFPTMTFKSTSVEVTGENTANVTGDLTLLGVTKPVVLNVIHNNSGKRPMNEDYVAGFSATAKIKRSDFGMNYGIPMVGDETLIRIEVEGVRNP